MYSPSCHGSSHTTCHGLATALTTATNPPFAIELAVLPATATKPPAIELAMLLATSSMAIFVAGGGLVAVAGCKICG